MSLELRITDPAKTQRAQLVIAIAILQAFHDGDRKVAELADLLTNGAPAERTRTVELIAPDDNPATGVDLVSPEAAFADAAAASAFSGAHQGLDVVDTAITEAAFALGAAASAFGGEVSLRDAYLGGSEGNAPPLPPVAGSPAISTPPTVFSPPAPPSAPSVAGAPAAAGGVELDVDGLPWDVRIHAKGEKGAKPKNADGRWRKKRGVDEALVAQVEAQLRQLMSTPAPNAQAGAPVTPPPAPPAPAGTAPQPPAPPAPSAPSVGAAPTISFADLAMRVGGATISGKVSQDEVVAMCAANGVASFALLVSRPDLLPAISTAFDQLLASKG